MKALRIASEFLIYNRMKMRYLQLTKKKKGQNGSLESWLAVTKFLPLNHIHIEIQLLDHRNSNWELFMTVGSHIKEIWPLNVGILPLALFYFLFFWRKGQKKIANISLIQHHFFTPTQAQSFDFFFFSGFIVHKMWINL